MAALAAEQQQLVDQCDLTEEQTAATFATIAEHLEAVIAAERQAMQLLAAG